jgi:death-on-curing protein
MNYINLEQLLQLHVMVINQSGGSDGLRDLGRLESALASQEQVVFGDELYKTVFEKAAVMTRGVIADHPFIDGNKRTGMLAGSTLLQINGYKLVVEKGGLENFAVLIAVDHCSIEQIAAWFKSNSIKS